MASEQAVDVSSLLMLRELQRPGAPDAVGRIVSRFLEEADERLDVLDRAVAERDAKLLEQAAHAMKGIAGTVGANEVREIAWRLEQLGRSGMTDGSIEGVDELHGAFSRARPTFEALREPADATGGVASA